MKTLLTIAFYFILGATIAQQNVGLNKSLTYFSDVGAYNEVISSAVATDSNYYLLMKVTNDSLNYNLILVKTDLQGNKLKSKNLSSDTSGHFTSSSDNTLIIDKDTTYW
jgi:hypothetical protein